MLNQHYAGCGSASLRLLEIGISVVLCVCVVYTFLMSPPDASLLGDFRVPCTGVSVNEIDQSGENWLGLRLTSALTHPEQLCGSLLVYRRLITRHAMWEPYFTLKSKMEDCDVNLGGTSVTSRLIHKRYNTRYSLTVNDSIVFSRDTVTLTQSSTGKTQSFNTVRVTTRPTNTTQSFNMAWRSIIKTQRQA